MVLILVLMEDALRDTEEEEDTLDQTVLILVLMEDALRDRDHYINRYKLMKVLILVLMEDALRVAQVFLKFLIYMS